MLLLCKAVYLICCGKALTSYLRFTLCTGYIFIGVVCNLYHCFCDLQYGHAVDLDTFSGFHVRRLYSVAVGSDRAALPLVPKSICVPSLVQLVKGECCFHARDQIPGALINGGLGFAGATDKLTELCHRVCARMIRCSP